MQVGGGGVGWYMIYYHFHDYKFCFIGTCEEFVSIKPKIYCDILSTVTPNK